MRYPILTLIFGLLPAVSLAQDSRGVQGFEDAQKVIGLETDDANEIKVDAAQLQLIINDTR